MDLDKLFENGRFIGLFRLLARNSLFTANVVEYIERRAFDSVVAKDPQNRPLPIRRDKYDMLMALMAGFLRAHKRRILASGLVDRLISSFVNNVILSRFGPCAPGSRSPFTVAISPTRDCNLRCVNCCACGGAAGAETLEFAVFDRILTEKDTLWNSRFTVITGGEPFAYRSRGRTILDAAARHPEQMFLVYTNGTLISDDVAGALASLGNVSPAVSVDGFERETDARRGQGVYRRVMDALARLRKAGVPFGVSVTVTRENCDLVCSRRFVEHFLLKQGAVHMWTFQYMPVGREPSLRHMVTPQQRVELQRRTWDFVRKDRFFIADFSNSGTAANGCMAAGRPGGYLHVEPNGDVTPCVFVPYAAENINSVYARSGNLGDVLEAPFFKYVRRWQDAYGYAARAGASDNWLTPCFIRDHFACFSASVRLAHARPVDEAAAAVLSDKAFAGSMVEYGKACRRLTEPTWRSAYLRPHSREKALVTARD